MKIYNGGLKNYRQRLQDLRRNQREQQQSQLQMQVPHPVPTH